MRRDRAFAPGYRRAWKFPAASEPEIHRAFLRHCINAGFDTAFALVAERDLPPGVFIGLVFHCSAASSHSCAPRPVVPIARSDYTLPVTLRHSLRVAGAGAVAFGLLAACGDDNEDVGVHTGSPGPTTSDGGGASPAPGDDVSDGAEPATSGEDTTGAESNDDASAADDQPSSDDTPSSLDSGGAGPDEPRDGDAAVDSTDSGPSSEPSSDPPDGMAVPPSDASVDDPSSGGPDEPDSGALPRGLGTDELAGALQRYWLVDAQIGGCGDLFRYERFAVQPSFSRLVYSTPGCSGAYPDGSSEYPGTYQLSGRRLTVTQADIALEEQYDIAIEETESGLVQHPGIYLQQSDLTWTRRAARERRDDAGALQWSIASSVTVDFGADLPPDEGEPCSVSVNVQLEFEELEPEGDFLLEFGPYTCSVERMVPDWIVALPMPAAEELSMLDTLTRDTVLDIWPTRLRLPRRNAEYLLPLVGYPEIAESDVQR